MCAQAALAPCARPSARAGGRRGMGSQRAQRAVRARGAWQAGAAAAAAALGWRPLGPRRPSGSARRVTSLPWFPRRSRARSPERRRRARGASARSRAVSRAACISCCISCWNTVTHVLPWGGCVATSRRALHTTSTPPPLCSTPVVAAADSARAACRGRGSSRQACAACAGIWTCAAALTAIHCALVTRAHGPVATPAARDHTPCDARSSTWTVYINSAALPSRVAVVAV